jgi:hypothetical protein
MGLQEVEWGGGDGLDLSGLGEQVADISLTS